MKHMFERGLENLEEGNFSFNKDKCEVKLYGEKGSVIEVIKPYYKIGEVVAVAQAYSSDDFCKHIPILHGVKIGTEAEGALIGNYMSLNGWNNKMFVRADLMPHQIRITDIRVERLQDISDGDCMKEGIRKGEFYNTFDEYYVPNFQDYITARSPKQLFEKLINRANGKGTWEKNPWTFVYEFELVK